MNFEEEGLGMEMAFGAARGCGLGWKGGGLAFWFMVWKGVDGSFGLWFGVGVGVGKGLDDFPARYPFVANMYNMALYRSGVCLDSSGELEWRRCPGWIGRGQLWESLQ